MSLPSAIKNEGGQLPNKTNTFTRSHTKTKLKFTTAAEQLHTVRPGSDPDPRAIVATEIEEGNAHRSSSAPGATKREALALGATAPPHCSSSTAVLLAHALLLGLGLGLLGCACVLLLPVLLLLLPRVLGRLGCPPCPRRPRRKPSPSRRGPGSPHRRSKLTRMRMKNQPFWVCALALLGRYFSLVGAAPLTDTTFKQASWGT